MPSSPNDNSDAVVRLTLASEGKPVDNALVQILSVRVCKQLNKIPWARIVLLDGDMPGQDFPLSNTDTFKPGSAITINAGYGDNETTIFSGIVLKHSIKVSADSGSCLVIECKDKAVKLTLGRKNANYTDIKDSEIISSLVTAAGLSADVEATSATHEKIVQYYCSDWDFILSRAEANGLVVIVENGKLTVKAPAVSGSAELSVHYGQDLIEIDAELDAQSQLGSVESFSWDLQNQKVISQKASTPPLNKQGDLDVATLASVAAPSVFRLQSTAPLSQESLKAWADGCLLKAGLARIRGKMVFQGSSKALVGSLITLAGVGQRFNGDVYTCGITHEIATGNWLTRAEFGLSPHWFSEQRDLVAPPAAGLLPGVDGLVTGVVSQLDGDPAGENRIQVTVPVLQAETQGIWARLAQFYASDGIGAFFLPEIGDEVILGYFNNDPSHPVILGSLYSSKRQPPYALEAENNTKAIVTRSGLKLIFDEEKKVLTLLTPSENTLVLSDEDSSILIQDQNNNKVELSSSGISLESPKDITITAQGKIDLQATQAISISSNADVKVSGLNINQEAQVGFTAKGSATAELSASGQTTVKGAMVMIN